MSGRAGVRLLVVAAAQDDAELVERHLRNAGQAVRAQWVVTPDDTYEALGQDLPDMVLCADDAPPTGIQPVLEVCRKRAPRVPVIVISNVRNMERVVSMMKGGARDVVSRRNLQHIEMVVRRELQAYRQAQELADVLSRLQDVETRHQTLLQDTKEAVAYVQEGILTHANPAFKTLLGYENSAQLDGAPLMDLVAAADRKLVKRRLHSANAKEGEVRITLKRADGEEIPIGVNIRPVDMGGERQIELVIDASGQPGNAGTGTAERDTLYEDLAQLAAPESARAGAVLIFIRADGVENLQERLGLRNTDRLLDGLREAVAEAIAESDRLFRFETGEYALVMTHAGVDGKAFADGLRETVAGKIFTAAGHSQPMTMSQVVCPLPENGFDADAVLRDARTLARKLCSAGSDAIEVLSIGSNATEPVVNDGVWKKRIELALAQGAFYLAFQSIASLEDDTQRHFDVFLRMRGANNEEIKPGEFLPSAGRLGLSGSIDRWVIEHVFELLAQRSANSVQSYVFIKLSSDSVMDGGFLKWIKTQIAKRRIEPQQLVLQVREYFIQDHFNEIKTLAAGLRDMGCRFSIDHFGDSAQSLPVLDHVPVDFIKIAPHLTQALGEAQQPHAKLRQIMERAQELKIKTVAEHVQNANAMALLWQLGVNYIQGNFVQSPEVIKPYPEAEAG